MKYPVMPKTIRHLAVDILIQVQKSQDFASELISNCLDRHSLSGTPDGRLLTHLVYGVLRFRGHLDWILGKLYRGTLSQIDEGVKNILRLSLYQLKYSDRLPAYAVVDEAVKIAKIIHPKQTSLVNAILRNYLRRGQNLPFPSEENHTAEYIAAFHSHPLWLVKKWLKIYGAQETKDLCSANNDLPPLTLRVNTLKISRESLRQKLTSDGFDAQLTKYSPDGITLNTSASPIQKTDFFKAGFLRIQDEAAQLIAYLIDQREELSLLDACAGTGGKTTHLAAMIKNEGRIVAVDRNPERIAELKQEAIRLGIYNIEVQTADLCTALPASFKERFDWVLVDAPCSGTGTLRRNPEIKWRTTEKDVHQFATAQKIILKHSSAAVKKGGFLIYCTCSLLPEENENIITDFLKHNAHFSISSPPPSINAPFIDRHGFFHSYPHKHHMDGLFAAILKY